MNSKNNDFIQGIYKKNKNVSDSYAQTEAYLRKNKIKPKVEASEGDIVLLVTKKGHQYTSGHVGTVTSVGEESYTFKFLFMGKEKEQTLPYNFLAKQGLITVGFYTLK